MNSADSARKAKPTVTDKIIIRELEFFTVIGVLPSERLAPRRMAVNLEVLCRIDEAAASDDISDAVDYRKIRERIVEAAGKSSYRLVESLAAYIADLVLDVEGVLEVKVTLDKPHALEDCQSVAIEITRRKKKRRAEK